MTRRTRSLTYNLSVCYYQHPSLKVCERETEDLEWSSPDSHRICCFRISVNQECKDDGPCRHALTEYPKSANEGDELRRSAGEYRWMVLFTTVISYMPQIFAPVLTFVAFEFGSRIQGSSSLSTNQAITSLGVVTLLTTPTSTLLNAIPETAAAIDCSEIPRCCSFMGGLAEWFKKARSSL